MNDMTMTPITGTILKGWGHTPGPAFPNLIDRANDMLRSGADIDAIQTALAAEIPKQPAQISLHEDGEVVFHENLTPADADEEKNLAKVRETMRAVMRTPTVVGGAILPDACPAGPVGTIPVGGVVAAQNAIHPGMHSADICCSLMLTDLGDADPTTVLDAASAVTHFGPGGRPQGNRFTVSLDLLDAFRANPFLSNAKTVRAAQEHMGTQGDGNHFLFVGKSRATGNTILVTHHGSRGPGAKLYKAGMEVAEKYRKRHSPMTLKQNAWIPADSEEGQAYWDALQLIRKWTKTNHNSIHQATMEKACASAGERFWNEHNFVFRRGDIYLHGKGATPAWSGFAADADPNGRTIIPMNMAEPILIVRGSDASNALGFSPHGAGRNWSRTEHMRRLGSKTPAEALAEETAGLDVRFYEGKVDASELPSSYKPAVAVEAQIDQFGLATVEDWIDPVGSIMAGELPRFTRRTRGRK
ncbi:RNA-splicing ligase RtcB, repairs tRNA damage [Litoreibacter ascidiaceicola]|uniref:3'-phosphate/5'-hydroxy nucleic acid ligase n=1 Tax=Litoreibacter ascidiaceicola TaxID=1486859 RepID=A0A1M5E513_9RHOB|nr:RtcB family protein [Litoreibacter ascidiaceicola]SHF74327.1 RNA-splicing ligase RtcB, repairs tRNA damage [Litoreibacter ascidiaceicola]